MTAGSGSIAIGDGANTSNNANCIAIGYAKTDFIGEINITNGMFTTLGDIHTSRFPAWTTTTTATPTEVGMSTGGSIAVPTKYIILTTNSTYIFDIDVVARKSPTGTDYSAWNLRFCINMEADASTTSIIGSVTKTLIGQTAGASGWDVSVTADTTNGRPKITVTGEASKTIRWLADIKMSKVKG